ncbi:ATP-binding protein [uncultured Imperialibacter sp.]|uniref:AlbA family DNA-binding domain-containing protein n=1 Tax=uncultured Imperialibacter sp. TaxID=1672639 RepID=UPI0030DC66FD|tara:strand:+ start:1815 stop:2609 length:795 start_codon:yes stop_codon:yes gene_type:complete
MNNILSHIKTILIQTIIGAGIFYFFLHPFTMVLYWFELSDIPYSLSKFQEIFSQRLNESFSFNMRGMGGLLTLFGAVLGLISSLFWIKIKIKNVQIDKQQKLLHRDLSEIIADGESERVEFKSSIRYDYYRKAINRDLEKVIAKTITGFMNAKGGKLIIGVDDDGNIIGLDKDLKTLKHKNKDGYEREIFRIISTQLGHEACFSNYISFYKLNGEDVCVIDIEPSKKPIYVSDTENTTFYVRTGNATYPLTVREAVNYLETRKL